VVQTVQSNHEVEEFHVKLAGSSFAARSSGRTYKRESLQKMVSYVRRFRRHRRIKVLENPGLECQSVELQSTVLRLKQKQHVALVQIEVVKTIFEHQTCFLNNLNTLVRTFTLSYQICCSLTCILYKCIFKFAYIPSWSGMQVLSREGRADGESRAQASAKFFCTWSHCDENHQHSCFTADFRTTSYFFGGSERTQHG